MNKAEIIANVAEKTGVTKKEATTMFEATIEVITEALQKEDKVSIPGFGSFEVKERKEREGINPSTREKMIIEASKNVKFTAGKPLKDLVNKK